jgi:hypothetical protein
MVLTIHFSYLIIFILQFNYLVAFGNCKKNESILFVIQKGKDKMALSCVRIVVMLI